jgi:hypothetical protein
MKAIGARKSNGKYAIALYRFRDTTSETSVSFHSNSGVFYRALILFYERE